MTDAKAVVLYKKVLPPASLTKVSGSSAVHIFQENSHIIIIIIIITKSLFKGDGIFSKAC